MSEVQMVSVRVVEVHGPFYNGNAQPVAVEIHGPLGIARHHRDVVEPRRHEILHGHPFHAHDSIRHHEITGGLAYTGFGPQFNAHDE